VSEPLSADGRSIVSLDRISRTYAMDRVRVDALREVSLEVREGEFVAIV